MNIQLGNIQFNEVEEKLGFRLTLEDKKLWDEFHNNKADLSGKDSSFHIFDMPRCINFKGEPAKKAIIKMFDNTKLVNPMGKIQVYEQK